TSSSCQVAGPIRGRQDRDGMAERAKLRRDAGNVLVHVVRLRPGERCDEADTERHPRPSLAAPCGRSRVRTVEPEADEGADAAAPSGFFLTPVIERVLDAGPSAAQAPAA